MNAKGQPLQPTREGESRYVDVNSLRLAHGASPPAPPSQRYVRELKMIGSLPSHMAIIVTTRGDVSWGWEYVLAARAAGLTEVPAHVVRHRDDHDGPLRGLGGES